MALSHQHADRTDFDPEIELGIATRKAEPHVIDNLNLPHLVPLRGQDLLAIVNNGLTLNEEKPPLKIRAAGNPDGPS
jgi:hypothetical protein